MDETLAEELDRLRSANVYRRMVRMDSAPRPTARICGRDVLVFGSNNYLGLANHPKVTDAAVEAARKWGLGATGSRLTTGNLALHEELEQQIADFKGCESAMLFGSGYAAAIGAIPALVRDGDLILSDALNHASLIDGCRLSRAEVRVYRHCDVDHARELLADRDRYRRCMLVTDGVFSMDGDIAPLGKLQTLCVENDAWLMVDDAHGTGVLGETGRGSIEHAGLAQADGLVQMGTLSKALGSEGGFIAGTRILIDFLRNRARSFIFSTAPSPPSAAAALAAFGLVRSEPNRRLRVLANANRLRRILSEAGIFVAEGETPIVPVVVGASAIAQSCAAALLQDGIFIPAIRPPSVPDATARLRISVTADHSMEDIERAANAVASAVVNTR